MSDNSDIAREAAGSSCQSFPVGDGVADELGDLGDDRVPATLETVHSRGNPMSHSTHVGFNCPPAGITPIAGSVSCPRRCPGFEEPFQSFAEGVGVRAIAVARSSPPLPSRFALAKSGPLGEAFGVGQILT